MPERSRDPALTRSRDPAFTRSRDPAFTRSRDPMLTSRGEKGTVTVTFSPVDLAGGGGRTGWDAGRSVGAAEGAKQWR